MLPPCCVVCGKVGVWLCETCAEQIPFADHPSCPRCGNAYTGSGLCNRCRTAPLRVAPIRYAFLYDGVIRDAIHTLKYRGGRDVAGTLARRMAVAWARQLDSRDRHRTSDLLIPVPLHAEREVQRGYNQSVLLARELSSEIGVPWAEDVLFRIRPTASQTNLPWADRRRNVQQAFACSTMYNLRGLRITLVDDVATTGATLDACAVALLARGARSVSAFTVAHAV
ncbi:MAG: ComF family protein [Anaerolineae bacterium]